MIRPSIYVCLSVLFLLCTMIVEVRILRNNIVLAKEAVVHWNSVSSACIQNAHKDSNIIYDMLVRCEESIELYADQYDEVTRNAMRNDLVMLKKSLKWRGITQSKDGHSESALPALEMKYMQSGPIRRCFHSIDNAIIETNYWTGNAPHRTVLLGEDKYIFIELKQDLQLIIVMTPLDRMLTYIRRFNYMTVRTAEYYAYQTRSTLTFPVLCSVNREYSNIDWKGNTRGACIEIHNGTMPAGSQVSSAVHSLNAETVVDRPFIFAIVDKKNDLLLYAGYLLQLDK